MSTGSPSARVHAMHARQLCFTRVKQERVQMHGPPVVCMLCMRGCGRKLVAIQTEAHACQAREQSLAVCHVGSVSTMQLAYGGT
jgi:hypothetical protein